MGHRMLRLAIVALAGILLPATAPAAPGAAPAVDSLVPDCHANASGRHDDFPRYASYVSTVCASPDMLSQLRIIDRQGSALLARLPLHWQLPFALQQENFPRIAMSCPGGQRKFADCIALAIRQRRQDVDDFAQTAERAPPDCKPGELSIQETGVGDAGMSKGTGAYLIVYRGTASCLLLGFPAIAVRDADGIHQWTYATYAGEGAYVVFPGPPLPVTLTPRNRAAWFSLSSSSGCDAPHGKRGVAVDIALPLRNMGSGQILTTIKLDYATCPTITVTPIGMISMMREAIR
jgi:hypothetical protein